MVRTRFVASKYPNDTRHRAASGIRQIEDGDLQCRLHLYHSFYRWKIPELFGLEFNPGLWNSGYVWSKAHEDQFLLITLNKQGKIKDHQYHDFFIDQARFHWQSQRSTSSGNTKGKRIINHAADGSRIHLFVRRNRLEGGKAAPFVYCGTVQYLRHDGEKPMDVVFELDVPITEELSQIFTS